MVAAESAVRLAQLAQPSPAYKRRVWLAVAGLVLFIVLYFLLAGWFLHTAYRLTIGAEASDFPGVVVAIGALFLAVFMLKPLLSIMHGGTQGSVEIKREEQPRLFAFLDQLADQAAAPRPHKVFLASPVNAGVFYDLSALNLLFPLKKNLEIGLGLVNALNLGEFRAVLAHEFGHFTQRSMAVMRWSYVAQQIAAHLVTNRDKLDQALSHLSRVDIRIAWIGWLLSLVVWSIRSLVDTAFGGVVLLQRALSREMEFQADLVAVSLTGSDALIHALHKLQAADDSWGRTYRFTRGEMGRKRAPRDVFTIHSRILERMRDVLGDPAYGVVAPVPADRAAEHRLFTPDLAQPPEMWLTHPLNHEREANAKRRYVPAPIDERSPWDLFENPTGVRERITAVLLEKPAETVAIEESLQALDAQFNAESLNPRYHGVYFGRAIARGCASLADMVEPAPHDWRERLEQLYPASLIDEVSRLRHLELEVQQLRALESGALQPHEGVIRHRGRSLNKTDLPETIAAVEEEGKAVEERLRASDRTCRSLHLAAATELGGGWAEYLHGLLALLHFTEHTTADLQDLHGSLAYTYHVVTVTRRVSSADLERLLDVGRALHDVLGDVYRRSQLVTWGPPLAEKAGGKTALSQMLDTFTLGQPVKENIGSWLNVIDGWVHQVTGAMWSMREEALDELLGTEAMLAAHLKNGTSPGSAPTPPVVNARYDVLLPGHERKREAKISWWKRFQIAHGIAPTIARLVVAGAIVIAVLSFGGTLGSEARILVLNGLARPIEVKIGEQSWRQFALTSQSHLVQSRADYRIESRTVQGELIDSFTVPVPGGYANLVYNVAGAAPLREWTAVYGNMPPVPERNLGAPRWMRASSDFVFDDPPERVETSGGSARRTVLAGLEDATPSDQLKTLGSDSERIRVLRVHTRWDETASPNTIAWFMEAHGVLPDFRDILQSRLTAAPHDVVLLRTEQETVAPADKPALCERHRALAATAPADPDLAYVAARCLADSTQRTIAFRDGFRRWPQNGWFAFAAGYTFADEADWSRAIPALMQARSALRQVREVVSVDLARLQRLTNPRPDSAVESLAKDSRPLRAVIALERGTDLAGHPLAAYVALAHGRIDEAARIAAADPEIGARLLWLVAASDGASPSRAQVALAPDVLDGLDADTRFVAVGLAIRERRDFMRFWKPPPQLEGDYDRVLTFIKHVQAGADPVTAERALWGLPVVLRGKAYSVAVIALGQRAPRAWRHAAKKLLFVTERPFFY